MLGGELKTFDNVFKRRTQRERQTDELTELLLNMRASRLSSLIVLCQLLLITNRKSHTGFGLIPTSMTLNDLERRNYYRLLRRSSRKHKTHSYYTCIHNKTVQAHK